MLPASTLNRFEDRLGDFLNRYSVTFLRLSLGAVFLGFGALKFFPGVSPAEDIAVTTLGVMTFGLMPHWFALVFVATLESVIGVLLLSGRFLRLALGLLVFQMVGILSPIVLLTGRLFAGPMGAPTLEGQYVLKDVILLAAVLVVAARVLRPSRDDEAIASDASVDGRS